MLRNLSNGLKESFPWATSPQGMSYWQGVYEALAAIQGLDFCRQNETVKVVEVGDGFLTLEAGEVQLYCEVKSGTWLGSDQADEFGSQAE